MFSKEIRKSPRRLCSSTISSAHCLKKIDYPGVNNFSQFSFDGLGRNSKIVETTSGSVTSTKQFVWCEAARCEQRDFTSSTTGQFFVLGEIISGSNYFYTADHLANDPNLASKNSLISLELGRVIFAPLFTSSIREMTNGIGVIQSQLSYDAYGRMIQLQGSVLPDFQFGDYYFHTRSALSLTASRAYSSLHGRFISRDLIEEAGGQNLYSYINNHPVVGVDPMGTCALAIPLVVMGGESTMGAMGAAMAAAAASAMGTMAGQAAGQAMSNAMSGSNSSNNSSSGSGAGAGAGAAAGAASQPPCQPKMDGSWSKEKCKSFCNATCLPGAAKQQCSNKCDDLKSKCDRWDTGTWKWPPFNLGL